MMRPLKFLYNDGIVRGIWLKFSSLFLLSGLSLFVVFVVVIIETLAPHKVAPSRASSTHKTLASLLQDVQHLGKFGPGSNVLSPSERHLYKPRYYSPKKQPAPLTFHRLAPVIMRIDTKEPVIFITIDDGNYPSPAGLRYMRQSKTVASLFLYDNVAKQNYDYFAAWLELGSSLQNHTISHSNLTKLSYRQQRHEICGASARLSRTYGVKPTLFRPPYGYYNQKTRRAVSDCGMKALVWWSAYVLDGKINYQKTDRLHRGDIVLLHFTPKLAGDLKVLLAQAKSQKLQVGRLEDWLR